MRRILTLLGPTGVLYALAALHAGGARFDGVAWVAAIVAVTLAFVPVGLRRVDVAGASRVSLLSLALACTLVAVARPADELSLGFELLHAVVLPLIGWLLVDLSATVPDSPASLRLFRVGAAWLAAFAAVAGVLAALPPLADLDGQGAWFVPARAAMLPVVVLTGCAIAALAARLRRARDRHEPGDLAANGWATLGLIPAVAALSVGELALAGAGRLGADSVGSRDVVASAAFIVAAVLVAAAHVVLLDVDLRRAIGPAVRALLRKLIALTAAVASASVMIGERVARTPSLLFLALALALALGFAVDVALAPWIERRLGPLGGRLERAVRAGLLRASRTAAFDDVARAVLGPLRTAVGGGEARLFAIDPPREATLDAAGEAHVAVSHLPPAILARVLDRPREVIDVAALEHRVVRRAELRPLVDALRALEAGAVVPLSVDGELDGALVVPRGRRSDPLSLEETRALEALGDAVAVGVALTSAVARAQQRVTDAYVAQARLEEALDEAVRGREAALAREAALLRFGGDEGGLAFEGAEIAYAPATRVLREKVRVASEHDVPMLFVAPTGTDREVLAASRRSHLESPRRRGPFLAFDASRWGHDAARRVLFGDDVSPGLLRGAEDGTLFIAHVPALAADLQRELADALSTRQAPRGVGVGAAPIDVRLVATSRLSVDELLARGALDPELARWLASFELRVPTLAGRAEDLPSLVLLALDRACRVLGREAIGVEPAALERLTEGVYPGDAEELELRVTMAVARADGSRLTLSDVEGAASEGNALGAASLAEIGRHDGEARALSRALEAAGGNKSEAARLLGLPRSTFLDKLRRHELDRRDALERAAAMAGSRSTRPVRAS